jgi:hypothetical protein
MSFQPTKVAHWYDAIIDWIIAHPGRPIVEAADALGRHPVYLQTLMRSDMLKQRLARRRQEMRRAIDEEIAFHVGQTANRAIGLLDQKLKEDGHKLPAAFLLDTTKTLLDSMGFSPERVGSPAPGTVNVTINTVTPDVLTSAREKMKIMESGPRRELEASLSCIKAPSEVSDAA